jgi:hypothetical protein
VRRQLAQHHHQHHQALLRQGIELLPARRGAGIVAIVPYPGRVVVSV